jgi:DNA (cytosine-5)-methyltransferase 1
MKYFSMFSGIGGFELGIQQAFESRKQKPIRQGSVRQHIQRQGDIPNSDVWRKQPKSKEGHRVLNGICIGYSEIDKYADQIYQKHFGGKNYGDATKINPKELPDFDLLVGGFPCQAFSIAGKRKGFDDTRGTLFFDIARILAEKKPKHLVLENVKGLLSHDKGRTFQTIIGVLADLGYRVEWQILNSKDFGVPQNRERVIIVGHLGRCCGRKVFPIITSDTKVKCQSVTPTQWRRTDKGKQARRETQRQGRDLTPFNNGHRELVAKPDSPVGTITSQAIAKDSLLNDHLQIRRLTPLECERLQGFPDNWTEGLSDTQRYKTLGNAVTTNVITAVMEVLYG